MRTSVEGYDESVDVYSLGCVLVHMLTGKKPDSEKAQIALSEQSKEVRSLIEQM